MNITDIAPATLPATIASTAAIPEYMMGTVHRYFQLVFPLLPICTTSAMATAAQWKQAYMMKVHIRVNRHMSVM